VNAVVECTPVDAERPRKRRSEWDVQREVLFALVIREASARVGGQWVGAIWTLIEPLVQTMLLVTLYGIVMGREAPAGEYAVFLVTGMIPFQLYQNLSTRLVDGIEANRGLFSYRQVKPVDVLLARATIEAGMTIIVYLFCLSILAWLGYHVTPADPLAVMGVTALLMLFGTGYGISMAVVTHNSPRLRSTVRMTAMPLYLASGVMFPVDTLPREFLDILLWNPLLHLVELSRHAFIPAYRLNDGVGVLYPLLFALALSSLGLALYWANRQRLISS
jgi:capsular polysaccharide transport system permease protein